MTYPRPTFNWLPDDIETIDHIIGEYEERIEELQEEIAKFKAHRHKLEARAVGMETGARLGTDWNWSEEAWGRWDELKKLTCRETEVASIDPSYKQVTVRIIDSNFEFDVPFWAALVRRKAWLEQEAQS